MTKLVGVQAPKSHYPEPYFHGEPYRETPDQAHKNVEPCFTGPILAKNAKGPPIRRASALYPFSGSSQHRDELKARS